MTHRNMISWPRLGTITHVTSSPKWKIDIATAWTSPIILPATTYTATNTTQFQLHNQKQNQLSEIGMKMQSFYSMDMPCRTCFQLICIKSQILKKLKETLFWKKK
jgi:hypothetical protein